MDPTWVAKAVATLFLLIAILIYWLAERQARKTLKRLNNSDVEVQSPRSFNTLAWSMTFATVATGAVLWSL
jgi:putative membrane protein